jgi:hypothetical protein
VDWLVALPCTDEAGEIEAILYLACEPFGEFVASGR